MDENGEHTGESAPGGTDPCVCVRYASRLTVPALSTLVPGTSQDTGGSPGPDRAMSTPVPGTSVDRNGRLTLLGVGRPLETIVWSTSPHERME